MQAKQGGLRLCAPTCLADGTGKGRRGREDEFTPGTTADARGGGGSLQYRSIQEQGQNRTKTGTLAGEQVVGHNNHSNTTTTTLSVSTGGYDFTSTSTTHNDDSTSYDIYRRIGHSWPIGRYSYDIVVNDFERDSNWSREGICVNIHEPFALAGRFR